MPTNLLIPGKNATGASYLRDIQVLEQWARQPIQQLKAGAGITLSPASGLATDSNGNGPHPITISSSGGGGGTKVGIFGIASGPDNEADNTSTNGGGFLSAGQTFSFGSGPNFQSPLWDVGAWVVGGGWVVATDNGASVVMMPILIAPTFTGGPISAQVEMFGLSTDYNNQARWQATISLTSGQVYQTVAGDWSNEYNNGVNLTLVAGTGSGSGIVASNAVTYLGSVVGQVTVPSGTVFT